MVDIQSLVLGKYGIDITQENILKLYKIDNKDISPQELEIKIQETRKRWMDSVNGANEKNAARDRNRLEKADKFEAVLRDEKLRKGIFDFYNNLSKAQVDVGATNSNGSIEFAREYFELVATTKKIKKSDVEFFFKYFQAERKKKKAILEMLSKDMKVSGLGKEEKYSDEDEEIEGKKKDDKSLLIVNLFQEATILKIRRALDKYEEAANSQELCQRYPKLQNGLFEFLEIEDVTDAKQFISIMADKSKEVYSVRQEKGTEYVPLVDLFNILTGVGEYRDVVDNITEFKLLLKYPNLTPYMYSFVDVKPNTIKGIVDVANKDNSFRDETDFILNYYKPIHDNFGLSDSGISSIIRRAEKKARQNKILNAIDDKLGKKSKKKKLPIGIEIIHWLVYWPIFIVYFFFELTKAIFTEFHRFTIPVFVGLMLLEIYSFPKMEMESLLVIRKIFFKNQWLSFLEDFFGTSGFNAFGTILLSLLVITILFAEYVSLPLFMSKLISEFSDGFNKRFDWNGIERTFQHIFTTIREKTERQYLCQKKLFVKNKMPKVIINIVTLLIIIAIIVVIKIFV